MSGIEQVHHTRAASWIAWVSIHLMPEITPSIESIHPGMRISVQKVVVETVWKSAKNGTFKEKQLPF